MESVELTVRGKSIEALGELRVVDLREELKRRGLESSGVKDVLVRRLKEVSG